MRDRNIVTEPNFRKSLSKSRILSPKNSYLPILAIYAVAVCVDNFTHLGSVQSSDGYCRPDIRRRIALAASVMSSLRNIWKRPTTVTVYQDAHLSDTGCLRLAICIRDMDTTRC